MIPAFTMRASRFHRLHPAEAENRSRYPFGVYPFAPRRGRRQGA